MSSIQNQLVILTPSDQRYGLPLSAADRIERTVFEWWISARRTLILCAFIVFLPPFVLAVYRAIEARQHALAQGRAIVEQFARFAQQDLGVLVRCSRLLLLFSS